MKATPLLVQWHEENAAIYSAHFAPHGTGRLATAGSDNTVRVGNPLRPEPADRHRSGGSSSTTRSGKSYTSPPSPNTSRPSTSSVGHREVRQPHNPEPMLILQAMSSPAPVTMETSYCGHWPTAPPVQPLAKTGQTTSRRGGLRRCVLP